MGNVPYLCVCFVLSHIKLLTYTHMVYMGQSSLNLKSMQVKNKVPYICSWVEIII